MIHHLPNGNYVISSHGTWRPGSYESEAAANAAIRLPDEVLQRLQNHAGSSPISLALIHARDSIWSADHVVTDEDGGVAEWPALGSS